MRWQCSLSSSGWSVSTADGRELPTRGGSSASEELAGPLMGGDGVAVLLPPSPLRGHPLTSAGLLVLLVLMAGDEPGTQDVDRRQCALQGNLVGREVVTE